MSQKSVERKKVRKINISNKKKMVTVITGILRRAVTKNETRERRKRKENYLTLPLLPYTDKTNAFPII